MRPHCSSDLVTAAETKAYRATGASDLRGGALAFPVLMRDAKSMRHSVNRLARGATILEAVFAGAIIALFMGGLFEMNGHNLQMLKSGKESFAATLILEERLEQLRSGTWVEITSPTYLQDVLTKPARSAAQLSSVAEQIVVSDYPAASPPLSSNAVTRSSSGATVVVSSNTTLFKQDLVRADIRVTWSGTPGGRTRVRDISTVIAERGLITR